MQCPRCQQENPAHARFCLGCGARLALACASCGIELPGRARFCLQCGQAVAAGSAAAHPSPAPAAYTPKHLAEKILTSKAALEGERKQVTVLFADLKGSMELLADRDPEEARKILDPVLELMMEAVHHYEGTVNQVMGDGIMALFGAPLAHEDYAVRACYAALRMQESVQRYAEGVFRRYGFTVEIRVGLNSGEVAVRTIGSDLHMDYTAVGRTTHLAARLEQMAAAGSILISTDTLRLVEGYVSVKSIGPVPIKGLLEPVEIYELSGAGVARTRLQGATARGLTSFVGRDAEMEHLRRALELAGHGHGQLVAVVGEAGVGKSRLLYEFTHSDRAAGWLVIEAGSVSYGNATPYLWVVDLLRTYFVIEACDEDRQIREKVTGKLLTLDRSLEGAVSAVLSLLDVPVEDPQWDALDPPRRRQRTLDAVKRVLVHESRRQPLLLVFEDLHWVDPESQALLDSLVELLGGVRILLLANYRPEYEHRWGGKSYYTQLRTSPLTSGTADELLSSLLGPSAALQPLKRLLIERTEGNPFFLEETVRTLVETRALAGELGAYRLTRDVTAIQVAPTVHAVLAARIDRLQAEEKRVLQSAAVIGKEVPFVLLRAVVDTPEDELHRALAQIQAAEFLYETNMFPDLAFTFKHALTHDVAYETQLQDRRRALHARIVEAIEMAYPGRVAEHVEDLARHAFRGEAWEKALGYLRQAGAKTYGRCAYRQAVAYWNQALVVLRRLPETRDTIEQTIDVRLDLRNAHTPLGEHDRMLEHISAAEPLATVLDDPVRLGRVLAYMSTSFFVARDHQQAIETAERGLAVIRGIDDFGLEAAFGCRLAMVHLALGNYPRVLDLVTQVNEILAGDRAYRAFTGPNLSAVVGRMYLVRALSETGHFMEAISVAEEAIRIAESIEHMNSLFEALVGLGAAHLQRGALSEALPVLEHDIRLCQAAEVTTVLAWAAPCLGLAYALSGRVEDARPLLADALEHAEKATGLHALQAVLTGEGYLLVGQPDHARMLAERALRLSRDAGERGHEAQALRLLAELAARREAADIEQADDHYRQALSLAKELGMRPLVAHCHLGLGNLYRRTDKREQAEEHLATATTMYRDMGMTYWLEKAEAEMRDLG